MLGRIYGHVALAKMSENVEPHLGTRLKTTSRESGGGAEQAEGEC